MTMAVDGGSNKSRKRPNSVVERAISHVGGSPMVLASQLSRLSGEEVTRQRVNGWRMRGIFPRSMMAHVGELTNIPLEDLATAKPRPLDPSGIVQRAIRLLGEGSGAAEMAAALTKISGERFTRQQVNGWQALQQFPTHVAPWVHLLTRIPIKDLVAPRRTAGGGSSLGKKKSD